VLKRKQVGSALAIVLILLMGVSMINLGSSFVVEQTDFEYGGYYLEGREEWWLQDEEVNTTLAVNSSAKLASLVVNTHVLVIPHFNITHGPVSIVITTPYKVVLNHSMISGELVSGIPFPRGAPDPRMGRRDYNITLHYEGIASTVTFCYSTYLAVHADYPVSVNRTVTVTIVLPEAYVLWSAGVSMILLAIVAGFIILKASKKT
jgi:hypothetical protein